MTIKEFINENKNYLEIQKCTLFLPKAESVMYSYLIDLESWDEIKHLESDNTYFWANKDGFISHYLLGWSIKEITNAINNLVYYGYIETKVVNVDMRKRTYIKLNFDAYVRLNRLYEVYKKATPNMTKGELDNIRNVCSRMNNIDTLEYTIGSLIHTYEPDLTTNLIYPDSANAPLVKEPSVQDVNKSLNKQIDDNIEGTNEESINMNSKSYKNIMMFIDSLSYTDDTKDELKKWFNNVAKGRVSVNQLKDKLDAINQSVKNEDELYVAIHIAYLNNYMAFYPPKKSYNYNNYNTTNSANNVTYQSRTLEEIQKERDEIALFMQTGEKF